MANKPIEMKKLKAALRLHFKDRGKRAIAQACGISKNTVKKYIQVYYRLGVSWEELEKLNDKELSTLFVQAAERPPNDKLEQLYAFFPYVQKELRKTGVTRRLLWEEYRKQHPQGYMQTQFCEHYRRWGKRVSPAMRIEYKAGDKMLVDYAGKKLKIVDRLTKEEQEVEVFVAILGASQLIYVEASSSQQKVDFIRSCENALHHYGGVPQAIVTDNLKSAVTKSHRYEPQLNADFADFAEHYETAVLPTRAYKPKDKALVEGAVRIIYRQIYAQLRNDVFYCIEDLNTATWKLLQELNQKKLTGRPYSRQEFFEEVEEKALAPLPAGRFEIRNYAQATVLQNGHVHLKQDRHYYSVPYKYIRNKVRIAYTAKEVKVFYKYDCIAIHKRTKGPFSYTTDADHLASTHKQYTKWNPEYFLKWATSIHEDVEMLIFRILEKKQHPEQAYRSCIGVLCLNKKVGQDRFIKACSLALEHGRHSFGWLQQILERGLDKIQRTEEEVPVIPTHDNIRGKDYYVTKTKES
jgi:transposase